METMLDFKDEGRDRITNNISVLILIYRGTSSIVRGGGLLAGGVLGKLSSGRPDQRVNGLEWVIIGRV